MERVERREHREAVRDALHGNIIGAVVHQQRANAAGAIADNLHNHGHHGHHHHHHGGGMGAAAAAMAYSAGAAAGMAAASMSSPRYAPGVVIQPQTTTVYTAGGYGPPPGVVYGGYGAPPVAMPMQPMPMPMPQVIPSAQQPVYAPAPGQGGAAPYGMQWVQTVPHQWSLSPAFPGQAPGSQTSDGTNRPLYSMMQLVSV